MKLAGLIRAADAEQSTLPFLALLGALVTHTCARFAIRPFGTLVGKGSTSVLDPDDVVVCWEFTNKEGSE